MKQLHLFVDTLRCEVDDEILIEELMATEGVLAVEVNLANEWIRLAFDEEKTSKPVLLSYLGFFGLRPSARPVAPSLGGAIVKARTSA